MAIACLLQPGSGAGQSAEWWYIGRWDDELLLHFIDAGSIKRPTPEYARFNALTYYTTPWVRTDRRTGERHVVAYEKLVGAFDCRGGHLRGQRFLFNANEQLFAVEELDPFEFVESPLVSSEYAFVCLGERAAGSRGFRPISEDPVAYSRRQTGK